jgi:16S rRNA (cytosine1402-N4)-methyltransferase
MHIPVLLREVVEVLDPKEGEFVADLTVGAGGHAFEFAKKIGKKGKLLIVDWDDSMLELAEKKLSQIPEDERPDIFSISENFSQIDEIISKLSAEYGLGQRPDIYFLDLGLSSVQLLSPERGFSIYKEGPLDMRISREIHIKAKDVIMHESPTNLEEIFRKYGEEKFARVIAEEIVKERKKREIKTTRELAEIVERIYRRKGVREKIHPATRVFQALRIYINRELDNISVFLQKVPHFSKVGTRVGIISFHSLEDRIVKQSFKDWEKRGWGQTINRKPITPSDEEIITNPRSRSAKFRAFVFLSPPESP